MTDCIMLELDFYFHVRTLARVTHTPYQNYYLLICLSHI